MRMHMRKLSTRGLILGMGSVVLVFVVIFVSFNWSTAAYTRASAGTAESSSDSRLLEGDSAGSPPCQRSLQFAAKPLPVTALASCQGSGNTWMRHLLQQLTGIYTGSVYRRHGDPQLWAKGYYGEGVANGSVIAIKTHGLPSVTFHRAIVIIRNPFDAMFADFNRRAASTGDHVGIAPAPAYFEYWYSFSNEYAMRWKKFYEQWAQFQGPLLFINFDDLVHSLQTTIEKVADFLKHPSVEMDVRCALSNSEGDAKRGQISFQKEDVFSRQLTRLVNDQIWLLEKLLKPKFPDLSQAVGKWNKNVNRTLRWRPIPVRIV